MRLPSPTPCAGLSGARSEIKKSSPPGPCKWAAGKSFLRLLAAVADKGQVLTVRPDVGSPDESHPTPTVGCGWINHCSLGVSRVTDKHFFLHKM